MNSTINCLIKRTVANSIHLFRNKLPILFVKFGVLAPTIRDNLELATRFQRKSSVFTHFYFMFSRVPKRVKMPQGPIIKLSVGDNFTIALLASGEMFGWGANENGQLKLDSSYLAEPTPIKVST